MVIRTSTTGSLHEYVVGELSAYVVSGKWPPGYLVPTEAELCALLGVSRSVLREAVRVVVHKGLMAVRQGKGTIITPVEQWDLLDPVVLGQGLRHAVPGIAEHVVEVRRILEPAAAGLAAQRATVEQCERLEAILRQAGAEVDNLSAHLDLTSQFHETIVSAAANPVLSSVYSSLQIALRVWRSTLADEPLAKRVSQHEEHERILAAVLAGDPVAASEAMAVHINSGFGHYVRSTVSRHSMAYSQAVGERARTARS